jgi:hypothetical protein
LDAPFDRNSTVCRSDLLPNLHTLTAKIFRRSMRTIEQKVGWMPFRCELLALQLLRR